MHALLITGGSAPTPINHNIKPMKLTHGWLKQVKTFTKVRVYKDRGDFGVTWSIGGVRYIDHNGDEQLTDGQAFGLHRTLKELFRAVTNEANLDGVYLKPTGFYEHAMFGILD